jgi:predicted RNase H-like HicB family nuclease
VRRAPASRFRVRDDDVWVALCPELAVASQGAAVEEGRANLREAIELLLECADPGENSARLRSEIFVTQVDVAFGSAPRALRLRDRRMYPGPEMEPYARQKRSFLLPPPQAPDEYRCDRRCGNSSSCAATALWLYRTRSISRERAHGAAL